MLRQEQTHDKLVNELVIGNQSVHMCVFELSLNKIKMETGQPTENPKSQSTPDFQEK